MDWNPDFPESVVPPERKIPSKLNIWDLYQSIHQVTFQFCGLPYTAQTISTIGFLTKRRKTINWSDP